VADQHFRAGVVVAITRDDGAILAFERGDVRGAWQLPQGGLKVDEEPADAAWRELEEETGLTSDDVELTDEQPEWVVYEYPDELRGRRPRRGQAQRWFWFRARRPDVVPVPDGDEFVGWKWVDRDWLVANVVEFRRTVYRQMLGGR
jgi:putative (di)nucleoside polyphosphate hydrolase